MKRPKPNVIQPEYSYIVWIPEETLSGQTVSIELTEPDGGHKMHAETVDQSEVYFEVTAFAGIRKRAPMVGMMQKFLEQESPEGNQTQPVNGQVGHLTGTTFDFSGHLQGKWKERRFLWLDHAGRSYRIILDPTSKLNVEILGTLRLTK